MSYESPVKIYETMGEMVEKIREDGEYQIWAEIKRHVDVNKDELIKALKYDRGQYEKGYSEGYKQAVMDSMMLDRFFTSPPHLKEDDTIVAYERWAKARREIDNDT